MLQGGALPEVNGPSGSVLWLWLNDLFSGGTRELIYSVRVLGGAPDIDPAGDELRKTTYSYENLYKAWRVLKSCSTHYVDPSGTRVDSTLELLVDNYVIDAYAYWTIDKLSRPAWLAKQTGIKASNAAGGLDVMSRPLCRPPPEGVPLSLFDEYKASDDLLAQDAAQQQMVTDLTRKLVATEEQLERCAAQVAEYPAAMARHADEKITASLQTFQAQHVALQVQLAHITSVRDKDMRACQATIATEHEANAATVLGYEARIKDMQAVHADLIREMQAGVRARVRTLDETHERRVREVQEAASIDRERLRRELKLEFDRTLTRHAADVAACQTQVRTLTAQNRTDAAARTRESEGALEHAREEGATTRRALEHSRGEVVECRRTLQAYTERVEGQRAELMRMNSDTSIRRLQDTVSRLDDKADRSCSIM